MDDYARKLFEKLQSVIVVDSQESFDYSSGIERLIEIFKKHKTKGTLLFFIGNGGSAAIAMHMTADFMKNGGMNTVSLYDPAVITCLANDYGYEQIFARQLEMKAGKGDLLVAISSSGESDNIIKAVEIAKEHKTDVITFTGFSADNKARGLGDISVYVPSTQYGIVESIHNLMLQEIVDRLM